MRAQIGVDVVPISVAHVQNLLQQKNIGVTYWGTSNFKMGLVRLWDNILSFYSWFYEVTILESTYVTQWRENAIAFINFKLRL
jgi:hypothetical protein